MSVTQQVLFSHIQITFLLRFLWCISVYEMVDWLAGWLIAVIFGRQQATTWGDDGGGGCV